jgi:flavodoxin I
MPKIGIFYGSSTGNTEAVAFMIKEEFANHDGWDVDVHNIGATTPEKMKEYDHMIMGVPTWNTGEMQDDWDIFLPNFSEMDLSGKKVAMFGLGDQNGYGFNFLDALGQLGNEVMKSGAEVWGMWKRDTYEFEESKAVIEDHFLGLGVDQEGQQEMTNKRIKEWVVQVIDQFSGKFATA